jgi:hypothetical protein
MTQSRSLPQAVQHSHDGEALGSVRDVRALERKKIGRCWRDRRGTLDANRQDVFLAFEATHPKRKRLVALNQCNETMLTISEAPFLIEDDWICREHETIGFDFVDQPLDVPELDLTVRNLVVDQPLSTLGRDFFLAEFHRTVCSFFTRRCRRTSTNRIRPLPEKLRGRRSRERRARRLPRSDKLSDWA